MSKEKSEIGLNPQVAGDTALTVSRGVEKMIAFTKTKAGLSKILADDHARNVLTTTMQTFISVDVNFELGMKSMGEVLFNLIEKQPEDMKRKALAAFCEAQGVAAIELDAKHPRMSFAAALFARFPDMQKQVKGGKDTYAAQRISAYTGAYLDSLSDTEFKKATGRSRTKAPRQKTDTNGGTGSGSGKPRSAADLFLLLYRHATATQQQTLLAIAQQAKIDYQGWLPSDSAN